MQAKTRRTTAAKKKAAAVKKKPAAVKKRSSGKGAGKDAGAKRREERSREVILELERVRADLDIMTDAYRLRIGGRVEELLRYAHGDPALSLKPRPFTIRTADAMLEAIRVAELKPKKGRVKDFARMQELVAALDKLGPSED